MVNCGLGTADNRADHNAQRSKVCRCQPAGPCYKFTVLQHAQRQLPRLGHQSCVRCLFVLQPAKRVPRSRLVLCSTRKGGFLTSGTNFRLFQLICSVFILLFTTSSIIQARVCSMEWYPLWLVHFFG